MYKKILINNIMYYLVCGLSGSVIAVIVWTFLRLMHIGINLIWTQIPESLNFKYYSLVVCAIGGLILGIFQKLTNAIPDELDTVIAKVKKDKFYPYDKIIPLCISALIPLIFGGSIGPEAGLTGVIVGLCYWAGKNMKHARERIPELMNAVISSSLSSIFYAPLFGLIAPTEEKFDNTEKSYSINSSKMLSNFLAVLFSIGTLFFLNTLFGVSIGLPRIGDYTITNKERLWGILLSILGALFGVLYTLFGKVTYIIFSKIQSKYGIIVSTILGGIVLGIMGMYMPLVMFSGEAGIIELQTEYQKYTGWALITIGTLKLLITNVCIKSGWKGGHFFPVIFCGISIGYGLALLLNLSIAFCAAVITAGLLGATMKKPLSVTLLLLLCFDIRIVPWMLIAAFIGSVIPTKQEALKDSNI